tara:strand:+ start:1733 stop:3892 length:2160 start_codon:yes stop_codon:yes gene_type:complete
MAKVIKSKGNEIFTANVPKVNTNTGSDFVTGALQRATNRISDAMYNEAVVEQKELGREAALKAPIRDPQGNLQFVDVTKDMSRVARNAARPILERDYARAFRTDVDKALIEARANANSSDEFITASERIITGMREAVPEEFQFLTDRVIEENSAIVQNQHYSAMLLDEAREQERIRLQNLELSYLDQVGTVKALVSSNQYGSAGAMRDAILNDMNETGIEDGLTDQFIKNIRDKVDQAYYGEIVYREVDRLLSLGDEASVIALRRAFVTGDANDAIPSLTITQEAAEGETQRITIPPDVISQEQLDSISNPATRRVIANQISVLHGIWSDDLNAKAEMAVVAKLMSDLADGNNAVTGAKAEQRLNVGFAQFGIEPNPESWASDSTYQTINNNPELLAVFTKGNILPKAFQTTLNGVANGDIQLQGKGLENLLGLYNLSTKGLSEQGTIHRPKGMPDSTFMFWESVHSYANTFGREQIADGVNFLNMGSGRREELESKVQIQFEQANKSATKIITDYMIENQDEFDGTFFDQPLTPRSIEKLMPVAIRAFGSLSKGEAVEVIANAYQAIYVKTDLIKSPDNATYARHEFAPEAFYRDPALLKVFMNNVDNIISQNIGQASRLGETHFLWPSNQSTNRRIKWTVVDAEGNYVPANGSRMPLIITTDQINRNEHMKRAYEQGLSAKINRARNFRSALIDAADESITGTGTQAEDYLRRRGLL